MLTQSQKCNNTENILSQDCQSGHALCTFTAERNIKYGTQWWTTCWCLHLDRAQHHWRALLMIHFSAYPCDTWRYIEAKKHCYSACSYTWGVNYKPSTTQHKATATVCPTRTRKETNNCQGGSADTMGELRGNWQKELLWSANLHQSENIERRRERPLPVLEGILQELSQAKVFSKLDLKNGCWLCILDQSRVSWQPSRTRLDVTDGLGYNLVWLWADFSEAIPNSTWWPRRSHLPQMTYLCMVLEITWPRKNITGGGGWRGCSRDAQRHLHRQADARIKHRTSDLLGSQAHHQRTHSPW